MMIWSECRKANVLASNKPFSIVKTMPIKIYRIDDVIYVMVILYIAVKDFTYIFPTFYISDILISQQIEYGTHSNRNSNLWKKRPQCGEVCFAMNEETTVTLLFTPKNARRREFEIPFSKPDSRSCSAAVVY